VQLFSDLFVFLCSVFCFLHLYHVSHQFFFLSVAQHGTIGVVVNLLRSSFFFSYVFACMHSMVLVMYVGLACYFPCIFFV
jgi:hypothetical protein